MNKTAKKWIIASFIALVIALSIHSFNNRSPWLSSKLPNSITITIDPAIVSALDSIPLEPSWSTTVTNKEKIKSFIDCLKSGRSCSSHKCADRGTIILDYGDSKTEIQLLPGHSLAFFEIRLIGNYKIPRTRFVDELRNLGVPEDKLPLKH